MKIAKKVLAVVMALAMVGCFAAMAFAAPAPEGAKFVLSSIGKDKKGNEQVALYLDNLLGVKAVNLIVECNDAVVSAKAKNGVDPTNMTINSSENTWSSAYNTSNVKKIELGFNFLHDLWSSEKFESEDNYTVPVNGEHFQAVVLTLELAKDKTIDDVEMKLSISSCEPFGNEVECVGLAGKVVEPETDPETEPETDPETEPETEPETDPETKPDTTKPDTTKPDTTKPAQPDKPTGDTGMLAIAIGVVALAGAAFVIAKKRK